MAFALLYAWKVLSQKLGGLNGVVHINVGGPYNKHVQQSLQICEERQIKLSKGFVTLSLLFATQTLKSCCVGSQFWLRFAVRCCSPSPVASSKACLLLPVPGALDQLRRV